MVRTILLILDKYGLQVANLALLGFVSWKLLTNHLKHIMLAIENNSKKLDSFDKSITNLKERVSKVEGMVE